MPAIETLGDRQTCAQALRSLLQHGPVKPPQSDILSLSNIPCLIAHIDMIISKFHDKKLLDAIKIGHLVGVKSAIAGGANPNLLDPATLMPLTHFCATEFPHQPDILRALLEANATLLARDREGRTLIRRCVEEGLVDGVKIAIAHGADLSDVDSMRDTVLHAACTRGRKGSKFFDIARLLIDAGASLSAKNERGEIPLHHAARYGGDRMARFMAEKSDLNNADADGHTPMHAAALGIDNEDGVQALLSAKADLDPRDRNGQTPLHLIAGKTKTRPADIATVRILLSAGANAWARDVAGVTAYDVAESGFDQRREVHQELVKILKPKGVEPPRPSPTDKSKGKF